jgi:hypothetical protein
VGRREITALFVFAVENSTGDGILSTQDEDVRAVQAGRYYKGFVYMGL